MPSPLAIFSDIHSNLEALKAVLADVRAQGVTDCICLGDIVGYASGVRSSLRTVRELECPVLLGNHDEASCAEFPPEDFNETARAGVALAAARLTASDRLWLDSLSRTIIREGVTFTHASLADPRHWHYILGADDAREHFQEQTTRLSFCGHTHRPMVWWQHGDDLLYQPGEDVVGLPPSGKVLINVGSVGQPRDGDWRACYVIFCPEEETVEFRRVEYDIQRTKRKILRAGLPRFTAQRLSLGR